MPQNKESSRKRNFQYQFKCHKCGKTKTNSINLRFVEKFICPSCRMDLFSGAYSTEINKLSNTEFHEFLHTIRSALDKSMTIEKKR